MKKERVLRAPNMSRCIACYSCMLACSRSNYDSVAPQRAALQIRTRGGLQSSLVADICAACKVPDCAASCPTLALSKKPGGGVVFEQAKCIKCRACGDACPIKYIRFEKKTGYPIMCKHCSICVRFCPHDCLAMEEVEADE